MPKSRVRINFGEKNQGQSKENQQGANANPREESKTSSVKKVTETLVGLLKRNKADPHGALEQLADGTLEDDSTKENSQDSNRHFAQFLRKHWPSRLRLVPSYRRGDLSDKIEKKSSSGPYEYSARLVASTKQEVTSEPGFNLQDALNSVGGPVVEVGGPTPAGFTSLAADRAILPERPIMINREISTGVDVQADAGALPFTDNSIGIGLASALNMINQDDLDIVHAKYPDKETNPASLATYHAELRRMFDSSYDQAMADDSPDTLRQSSNPRIRLLAEFKRVIKPGGVFIYEGINDRDVILAKKLGFNVVERGSAQKENAVGQQNWVILSQQPTQN